MRRNISLHFFILLILLVILNPKEIYAQEPDSSWVEPTLLFQGTGSIYQPTVLADKYGYVHVFWTYTPVEKSTEDSFEQLIFTQWDGIKWSLPVDIISSRMITSHSAAMGLYGDIHLIWVAEGNNLYYSWANIEDALYVHNWSKPLLLTISGQYPHIQSDLKGRLFIVFPDSDNKLSYISSTDSGKTWSTEQTIAESSTIDSAISTPFLAFSNNGYIHAVWTEFHLPDGWPPAGVFYSRSLDDGKTWSVPFKIAGEGYDQINIITEKNKTVHTAWNGMAGVGGRYHRWSKYQGLSWSEIEGIAENGGTEGPPGMAIDSSDVLHLITSYDGAVWYYNWFDQTWSFPTMLPRGEEKEIYYIEQPSLSINGGNQLHAVFWSDRQKLWYTTMETNAPREEFLSLPVKELEISIEIQTPTKAVPTPSSTPIHQLTPTIITNSTSSPLFIFVFSVIPVILLVCGIALAKTVKVV